ncbi:MAG: NUDIX domain-containing protein [Acidimicrobiales bacterium]
MHAEDDAPLLDSGLHVPAGTVQPGESDLDAVLREAHEESGLVDPRVERRLGTDTVEWPGRPRQYRTFFHLTAGGPGSARLPTG